MSTADLRHQSKEIIPNRQYGIDFARLLAAYCVAFGHLAFGGTFAVDEVYQRWTCQGVVLPLLDREKQSLWAYDYSLLVNWRTSAGIIGVGLFFVISGWVVPPMLKKYSTSQFLINRVFRIFPMLIVSVLVAALIQYSYGNRDALSGLSVLSTMFLLNDVTGQPYSLGVVWTLIIEFKFYLLLALFGELTNKKTYAMVLLVAAMCTAYYVVLLLGVSPTVFFSNAIILDLHYIILMLIGSSLYLAIADRQKAWYWRFAPPLFLVLAFNLIRHVVVHVLHIRPWQDINLVSQVVLFAFFLSCLGFQKYVTNGHLARVVKYVSDITYSLYLLHLSLGIFLLSVLRDRIANQYVLVLSVMLVLSLISLVGYHGIEKRFLYRCRNKSSSSSRWYQSWVAIPLLARWRRTPFSVLQSNERCLND